MNLALHFDKAGAFSDRPPIRRFTLDALCDAFGVIPHDRHTASGEAFNPHAMTCAHRRHPFGSTLRVTKGGRSITCRVTDRGPFTRGRVIDLTPAAARALGFSGLARVSVQRM